MTHAVSPVITGQVDAIKDILSLMDALQDNKLSLLKLHATLRKAVQHLISPTSDGWLDALMAQLLKTHDAAAKRLWPSNLAEILTGAALPAMRLHPTCA